MSLDLILIAGWYDASRHARPIPPSLGNHSFLELGMLELAPIAAPRVGCCGGVVVSRHVLSALLMLTNTILRITNTISAEAEFPMELCTS